MTNEYYTITYDVMVAFTGIMTVTAVVGEIVESPKKIKKY